MKNAPGNKSTGQKGSPILRCSAFVQLLSLCLLWQAGFAHIYYSNQCAKLISPIDIMSPITFLDFSLDLTFNSVSKASVIKLPNLSEISQSELAFNRLAKREKDETLRREYTPFTFKISTGDLLSAKSVDSFGEIFYNQFKYSIRNIYVKFPSEHMIAGLGFSMELQFEAFTPQDQSLVFVKLFEAVEDFENPALGFLRLADWASLKNYQTLRVDSVDFTQLFAPTQTRLTSIVGDIEYTPKTLTDEVLEYSEMIPRAYNEQQERFREEKQFYFYTGQATSGDCEYALVFISRQTEFIGMGQFGLMGLKSKGLDVRNMLSERVGPVASGDADGSRIEIDHSGWQNIPDVYANFFYDDKFGEISSLGRRDQST